VGRDRERLEGTTGRGWAGQGAVWRVREREVGRDRERWAAIGGGREGQ